MPLTDTAIRNANYEGKPRKLTDEKGMYVLINKAGKYFRLNYRFGGKYKTLALGVYPDVSLQGARIKRDEARSLIAKGIDPNQLRKAQKAERIEQAQNTFEAVARRWFKGKEPGWAKKHSSKIIRRLERYLFPYLGNKPIADITPNELLSVLRKIESMGYHETAHRALQISGQVFRYARLMGLVDHNLAADLKGELLPPKRKHMATITDPKKIGGLLRAIDTYDGTPAVKCALQLAPLVFLRPGELRHAEWAEIDLDEAEWRIPGPKMKMKDAHIVPLATQATQIFRSIEPITGHGRYVFPGARTESRPISENAVLSALRRMDFSKDEICGHGFRGMASTILHGQGWKSEHIEKQLAHEERNRVKAAYNHAEYLPERKEMMQAWADYLDKLKKGE